jgi:tRNA (guanine-N1)-methyltransferase
VKVEVVTLFPEMISGALQFGIVGRAIERGLLSVGTEDPRAHTTDPHRTVDDRPYGGGPGMVLKPEPLLAAIEAARVRLPQGSPRIYLSAQGEPFGQRQAEALAALPGFALVAGRYEGLDERALALGIDRELSLGDYVLSGGELPALVVIDAVARLLPGAFERRGVVCRRSARLAALHATGSICRAGGTAGVIVGEPCRHPPLATEAGCRAHVVAQAGPDCSEPSRARGEPTTE